tara:strand:+ start:888 stop:1268 length:381 start_codon:yes stop_codon:yes gene_type:complete
MKTLSKELETFLKSNPKVLEELGSKILKKGAVKSKSFEVKNLNALASVGMIKRIAMTFLKHEDNNKNPLPKEINYFTIVGHFTARLNDKNKPLTQGQVSKILSAKSLPAKDIKAMQSYKKLKALDT